MLRWRRLEHAFVAHLPERLEPGMLYVSVEFATAAHLCCCGCGAEVVTPISPADWLLTFDGETVSLRPSIGSWGLPCRSHYFVDRNRVLEALPWSEHRIARGYERDRAMRALHFAHPTERQSAGAVALTIERVRLGRGWPWLRRHDRRPRFRREGDLRATARLTRESP